MHSMSMERRPYTPGLWLLFACTIWLVIQNTLLVAGFFWLHPHKAMSLAAMMGKVALVLLHG